MSQIVTRKSAVSDEKEKRTDSPIKDMKKKAAAMAEKEKQVEKVTDKQPEKADKPKQPEKPVEKNEKPKQAEKPAEKNEKPKQAEKTDKNDKQKQPEKEKAADKSAEKSSDKKVDKNGVDTKKTDNKDKKDTQEKKDSQEKKDDNAEKNAKELRRSGEKPKQNGSKHNGDANGVDEASDDEVLEIADYDFPELAYDESENESPTPDGAPSRSLTRRSQVKSARTPETPQPASEKPADAKEADNSKDSKLLKMTEAPPSDRKLRSDDPKPDKKDKDGKKEEQAQKEEEAKKEAKKLEETQKDATKDGDTDVIEIDDDEEHLRKTDTNYSKSRVKVSPYRRSTRLADQTASSVMANYTGPNDDTEGPKMTHRYLQVVLTPIATVPPYHRGDLDQSTSSVLANYTGNNTTMEMDITESSFAEEASSAGLDDSSYLTGLRSIRGRRSYKPLKDMTFKITRTLIPANTSLTELGIRPTGTVVGRKRKPESDDGIELAAEAGELSTAVHTKRMRLLDRIAQPFRRTLASTPLPPRRNPEIVGINTDLPLTAPIASSSSFDPETLKTPVVSVTPPTPDSDVDKKRCIVM